MPGKRSFVTGGISEERFLRATSVNTLKTTVTKTLINYSNSSNDSDATSTDNACAPNDCSTASGNVDSSIAIAVAFSTRDVASIAVSISNRARNFNGNVNSRLGRRVLGTRDTRVSNRSNTAVASSTIGSTITGYITRTGNRPIIDAAPNRDATRNRD